MNSIDKDCFLEFLLEERSARVLKASSGSEYACVLVKVPPVTLADFYYYVILHELTPNGLSTNKQFLGLFAKFKATRFFNQVSRKYSLSQVMI